MNESQAALGGRHALVTGASRGIGATIAAALAAEGARVSLVARDAPRLAALCAGLGGADRAVAIGADITRSEAVREAFAAARRHFGPVHILVNNAGQAASAKFTETDEALWNGILGVNLTGTYLCTREAVADMLHAGYGRIVNVASIAGLKGAPYISAYAASKHAVVGLTRSLALEYATRNITVNAVCPGYVDTDIVRRAIDNIMKKTGRSESEALATLTATNPQRRLITPAEVSHVVLWLCRPGTEGVTGQSIVIGGAEASG
jgi:NAD(P)-dependent dehydrogenase (short-subunit alcohol dehydrogenase family)